MANYGAEYGQSSLCGFQAECTMLFLRNHFGHPLHCPFQNVLSTLVLSMEQPSHNSPELWNWLTASLNTPYVYMYVCTVCMYVSVCLCPKLLPTGVTTPSPSALLLEICPRCYLLYLPEQWLPPAGTIFPVIDLPWIITNCPFKINIHINTPNLCFLIAEPSLYLLCFSVFLTASCLQLHLASHCTLFFTITTF